MTFFNDSNLSHLISIQKVKHLRPTGIFLKEGYYVFLYFQHSYEETMLDLHSKRVKLFKPPHIHMV